MGFKEHLIETIEDNKLEIVAPSREYSEQEFNYMRGYQQALEDMLNDYSDELDTFKPDINTFSLN